MCPGGLELRGERPVLGGQTFSILLRFDPCSLRVLGRNPLPVQLVADFGEVGGHPFKPLGLGSDIFRGAIFYGLCSLSGRALA